MEHTRRTPGPARAGMVGIVYTVDTMQLLRELECGKSQKF